MNTLQEFFVLPDLEKKMDEAIHDAINFFEKKCPYCSESLYSGHIRNKIHLDHFVPIANGGQNVPWNILPVCQRCNSKKHAKKPKAFLTREIHDHCEAYLKKSKEKYVGEIQINLEKFAQVKEILKKIYNSNGVNSKLDNTINLLLQIVLDHKPKNDSIFIESPYPTSQELEKIINKYFKIPESGDKIVKLSSTEIQEILSEKMRKNINLIRLSKKLKELGFNQKMERTHEKVKRCFTLGLK
ncbi:MAG: HNH endonuclease signature motif containing protein [Chitinophagaceae bacterium]